MGRLKHGYVTFKRFEEIEVWQMARALAGKIYDATSRGSFSRDFGLRDQIRRASVSIMSNIAEGFERGGNKEFCQFLSIAKGSAGEVKSQLYVAVDQEYISQKEFDELYAFTNEIGKRIGALITYLRKSPVRGMKFR